jgi:hypothetical protein
MSGFFFEISKGAICAGNVFKNCDNGSFVLNSSNVKLYQNTYINSKVAFGRTDRSAEGDHFGWHPATGPDIDERKGHILKNNLIVQNARAHDPLLEIWQVPVLCDQLPEYQLSELDYNVFVTQLEKDTNALIIWQTLETGSCSKRMDNPEEIHQIESGFSAHTQFFPNYQGPLFINADQKNYHLSSRFPAANAGDELPVELTELLKIPSERPPYVGAYPKEKP